MTSRVLEVCDMLVADRLATQITEDYVQKEMLRAPWKAKVEEIRRYVYATDTTQTGNASLPWKNKTTIPKTCQIRDNLYANYTATMFPQRKWLMWEANEEDANSPRKRDSIVNYMLWCIAQPSFKHEVDKAILDYIDYGNCFLTVEWVDQRSQQKDFTQAGYVGPAPLRISPEDIVFNPTADSFYRTPKTVRSIISIGELKEMLEHLSSDENRDTYEELWKYLKEIRNTAQSFVGDWQQRDAMYSIDGFGTFREYLMSDYVEVLTFYGDIYDHETDTLLKNHVITVVDRHKLINKKPNPTYFGYPPIFSTPWRKKQDNLWGMGPLDNLIGMQYRLDHIENMKADITDLVTYPVQKVKGFVEDYTWQPGEKIFTSEEGDVDLVVPNVEPLRMNNEVAYLTQMMEEMAGAPKEAMGFRTPGEKTKYEVQRLENASARIFQNKIKQFEEQVIEPLLNAMLEMARRNLTGTTVIQVFDNEFKAQTFAELTVEDITGVGRIKPVAARHFAEQAELIQNLTSLTQSNLWPVVQPHFSSVRLAEIIENIFNLQDYKVVLPYVALSEQAQAHKFSNVLEENVAKENMTATGLGEDYDVTPSAPPPPDQTQQGQ